MKYQGTLHLLIFLYSILPIIICEEEEFSIALIADIHYAYDNSKADYMKRLISAVNLINSNKEKENIKLVGILGDLAWGSRENMQNVKDELDKLNMPYVPVIGNNDINHMPDKGISFNYIYDTHFQKLSRELEGWEKAKLPVIDPEDVEKRELYLQNYAFDLNGLRIICADWNTRLNYSTHLIQTLRNHAGDLYDFPGGSWEFFTKQIETHSNTKKERILSFSHHPMHHSPLSPMLKMNLVGFSLRRFNKIKEFVNKFRDYFAISFGGHYHYPFHQYIIGGGYKVIVQYALKPFAKYFWYKPRIGLVTVKPNDKKFKFRYKYIMVPYEEE